MYLRCEIPVKSSLNELCGSDYINYIEDKIFSDNIPNLVATYNLDGKDVDFTFGVKQGNFIYYNRSLIFASAEVDCDDKYVLMTKFSKDIRFLTFIENIAVKFIWQFNNSVKDIKHPNIKFIFNNDDIFIKVNKNADLPEIHWESFSLDTNINKEDIVVYVV